MKWHDIAHTFHGSFIH